MATGAVVVADLTLAHLLDGVLHNTKDRTGRRAMGRGQTAARDLTPGLSPTGEGSQRQRER
jgi:hypothetical protein